MKLYNKTKLPDAPLSALLIAAGKAVGCRTGSVVVKVTSSRHGSAMAGCARQGFVVYSWHLSGCRRGSRSLGRSIGTDGGWIHLTIPVSLASWVLRFDKAREIEAKRDLLARAESFFNLAMHEWTHVRDWQRMAAGERLTWASRYDTPSGTRRIAHNARPEEQRAECAVGIALKGGAVERAQEEIIALAVAWEEVRIAQFKVGE